MSLDTQITHSYIGTEYGWDRVSDVDPEILRHNRASCMDVLSNPSKHPEADFTRIARHVVAIDQFFDEHGTVLEQFA